MLLAIDTSGKQGGIALARYDGEYSVPAGERVLEGGQYSSQLLPAILELIAAAGGSLGDVSAIAVITGPGSFTGLRVGLATVKGLCETRNIPVVGVSMLELIAASTAAERVTPVLDAGREEAYVGEFQVTDGLSASGEESLVPISQLTFSGLAVTPDAKLARLLGAVQVPYPNAGELAAYAVRKLARGQFLHADQLEAHYIRRSDAELKRSL